MSTRENIRLIARAPLAKHALLKIFFCDVGVLHISFNL